MDTGYSVFFLHKTTFEYSVSKDTNGILVTLQIPVINVHNQPVTKVIDVLVVVITFVVVV